jgi:hypothetical protein
LYKTILKAIWAYDVQLWPPIRIELLQRFQNQFLKVAVNALSYVTNNTYDHDLNVAYDCRDEVRRFSQRYADRMAKHHNVFTRNLMRSVKTSRRLQGKLPQDVPDRYNSIGQWAYIFQDFLRLNYYVYYVILVTACNNF